MEAGRKSVGQLTDCSHINTAGSTQSQNRIDYKTDNRSGNGGVPHGFYVGKQRHLTGRGSQQRRIGKRAHLISKESSGNHGSSCHGNRNSKPLCHAAENHADGTDGTPAGTGTHCHECRKDKADWQKQIGSDNLHTIIK